MRALVRVQPSFNKSIPTILLHAAAAASLLALGGCSPAASTPDGNNGGAGPGTTGDKTGLQVHLKLDEGNTNGAPADASGHVKAVYGTVKPTVSAMGAPGLMPTASLSFNGMATVEIPASAELNWSEAESYTISIWANPTTLPAAQNWSALITNNAGDPPGGGTPPYCGILISDKGTWSFEANGQQVPAIQGPAAVAGKWQHVVIVQNAATGTQLIYVDGVAAVQPPRISGCASPASFLLGSGRGAQGTTTLEDPYIGLIDDVRIYGQALTEVQVKELFTGKEITP